MKITKDEGTDIIYNNHEEWKEIDGTRDIIDQSRWTTTHEAIFLHIPTNKTYSLWWDEGSTECQDSTEPFGGDEPDLVEVVEKEVLVKKWVPTK